MQQDFITSAAKIPICRTLTLTHPADSSIAAYRQAMRLGTDQWRILQVSARRTENSAPCFETTLCDDGLSFADAFEHLAAWQISLSREGYGVDEREAASLGDSYFVEYAENIRAFSNPLEISLENPGQLFGDILAAMPFDPEKLASLLAGHDKIQHRRRMVVMFDDLHAIAAALLAHKAPTAKDLAQFRRQINEAETHACGLYKIYYQRLPLMNICRAYGILHETLAGKIQRPRPLSPLSRALREQYRAMADLLPEPYSLPRREDGADIPADDETAVRRLCARGTPEHILAMLERFSSDFKEKVMEESSAVTPELAALAKMQKLHFP
jgi:hypothetical protein